MGLLDFNVSELVTRTRAALGVRGRMPLAMEDSVAPVMSVLDVDRSPYRRNGMYYTAAVDSAAVAGQYSWVRLQNATDRPIMVNFFKLSNNNAGTNTFVESFEPGVGYAPTAHFATGEGATKGPNGAYFMQLASGITLAVGAQVPVPAPNQDDIIDLINLTANQTYASGGPDRVTTIPPQCSYAWHCLAVLQNIKFAALIQVVS